MTVAVWQSASLQDERSFKTALILSVLLHMLLLAYARPTMELAQRGDKVLTVSLTSSAETTVPESAEKSDADAQNVIALPAKPNTRPEQTVRTTVKPDRGAQPAEEQIAAKSGLVMSRGHSKVQVLLVIDSGGKVTQIHWRQLPAMTDEELKRLEEGLRQKIYLSNGLEYTVIEELD